ncbi:MAG: potassium/proton antiporter [Actinomycetota bacterium]|nr:potassium/proton antiporter [Actinomycetota bacterium]
MGEILAFGTIVLVVAAGFSLALAAYKLTERFPIPAPALFLLAAALASDVFPGLSERLPTKTVERIGVVALIVILFDGGMHVGWRRFRASAVPIALLGTVGTFATAGVMAVFAHYLFGFDWVIAGILGAALAPTDPAVMFSVLGNREVSGRSGTILEGESGANDPVGIALMIGMLELASHDDASFSIVVEEFAIEMAVGLAVGVVAAQGLRWLMQRVSLPNEGLYPLRTLAAAAAIYGVAAVAHGSGFLAVFVAGLLVSDIRAPYKAEIERFHTSLASLAEIVVFVALGLTIDITNLLETGVWLDGLVLAILLTLVARPLAVAPLLLPTRLRRGESLFVMWGGLKGAVPILLATLALLQGVDDAERIYDIVFVVVAFSVIVQGTSIPWVAARLGVPMRIVEPEPWDVSVRLPREPHGVVRYVVAPGSRADGTAIRDLSVGEHVWISFVVRGGQPRQARGSHVFEPGDEVLLLSESEDVGALRRLFEGREE